MSAEAIERMHFGADNHILAMNANNWLVFNDAPTKRATALVAYDQDVRFFPPEVVLEMVKDASSVAHAGTRHNEANPIVVVDLHRFLWSDRRFEGDKVVAQGTTYKVAFHVVIEDFFMLGVNPGSFDGHRTVKEDGKGLDFFVAKHPAQEPDQQLSSPDSKRRNEHPAPARDRIFHDVHEFVHGLTERTMVLVSVG